MRVMVVRSCNVCRMPVEPGESTCINCGAELSGNPAPPRRQRVRARAEVPPARKKAGNPINRVLFLIVLGLGVVAGWYRFASDEREDVLAAERERAHLEQQRATEHARKAEAPRVPARPQAPLPVDEPPPSPPEAAASQREPSEESPARNDAGAAPAAPDGDLNAPSLDELHFPARVTRVVGKRLRVGAPCEIVLEVSGGHVQTLRVSCGNTPLYDSQDPLNGMSRYGATLFERTRSEALVYRLQYTDLGQRSSRSQIELNSLTRQGVVFAEGLEAFRVELSLGEFSLKREGPAFFDTPSAVAVRREAISWVSTEGPAPPKPAGSCQLTSRYVETTRNGRSCKTEVRCGGRTLYGKGNSGFGPCVIRDALIMSFEDTRVTSEDGDPKIEVDLEAGRVRLEDDSDAGRWVSLFQAAN